MPLEVRVAPNCEREVIERMMGPYLTDLGARAGFAYPHLDAYWTDPSRYPYVIVYDDRIIGFALVRWVTDNVAFEVVELYINADFRKRGFAREAAKALFKLHPGMWTVAVRHDNSAGQEFWATVLSSHPVASTTKVESPKGIKYIFSTP